MADPKLPRMIIPKDRIFTRGRGCYNCVHYENDKLSRQHWATRRQQDVLHVMQQHGIFDSQGIKGAKRFQAIEDMDVVVQAGLAGICLKGKPGTDFVHHQYLCEAWTGREGASVATAGHPVDPLPEELHEIADSRAKKVDK